MIKKNFQKLWSPGDMNILSTPFNNRLISTFLSRISNTCWKSTVDNYTFNRLFIKLTPIPTDHEPQI